MILRNFKQKSFNLRKKQQGFLLNPWRFGGGGAPAPYDIGHSLRFSSSRSTYLSRTPSSASNRKTWTWKASVKRGSLTDNFLSLFDCQIDANTWATFGIYDSSVFWDIQVNGVFSRRGMKTAAILRDSSAHYDIEFRVDTTQATDSDRIRVYINGQLQTMVTRSPFTFAYPTLNADLPINSTSNHRIGNRGISNDLYFDGYLSDIHFVDGQSLDPSNFGEIDANGNWVPKVYTGTFGTNGFYLPFNNATSLATLTADASGNGNNWTATNHSLTAGSTYDWMEDTPTNGFCVLNPLESFTTPVPQQANLYIPNTDYSQVKGSVYVSSGKWYYEWTAVSGSGVAPYVGVATSSINSYTQNAASGFSWYSSANRKRFTDTSLVASSGLAVGDVIGIAIDCDIGEIKYYRNNTLVLTDTTLTPGTPVAPMLVTTFNSGNWWTAAFNFGQRPFSYTPPAGHVAICTKNLPTPVIVNPKQHFDTALWTGDGATNRNITYPYLQPELFWCKNRNSVITEHHRVVDIVRGTGKNLYPNLTAAEAAADSNGSVSAFLSNGVTVSKGSVDAAGFNYPAVTYAGWGWKAGGAAVANTDGSVASQVSANTVAGLSIVTFTAPASGSFTVGHGLGKAPKMVIVKTRSAAGYNWWVWHIGMGDNTTDYVALNLTNAEASVANMWGTVGRTSTLLGFNAPASIVGSQTYVVYCFAEVEGFSKISSYTGNGSANGPFVYCGFRPAFLLIKRIDGGASWYIIDTARDTSNTTDIFLVPNNSNAEGNSSGAGYSFDFLSNGFKLRGLGAEWNASGGTYVFMAFAEAPFKYARAR